METTTYYKIKETHTAYKGKRFFKVKNNFDSCVQVCAYPGEAKRGHANNIGITSVQTLGFYSNYVAPGYAERCTKKEFDKHFKIILDVLNL